jgi:two-component system cell cycle response regulator DivK
MDTILIIEDNEQNIKFVEDVLDFAGYHPVGANTAEKGLQLAHELKPSLILMDLRLAGSGMNGWEATRAIKDDSDLAHIPVIAVTAQVSPGEESRLAEYGFDGYVSKPFDVIELQNYIRRFCQG